jgi:hypothetical protein
MPNLTLPNYSKNGHLLSTSSSVARSAMEGRETADEGALNLPLAVWRTRSDPPA